MRGLHDRDATIVVLAAPRRACLRRGPRSPSPMRGALALFSSIAACALEPATPSTSGACPAPFADDATRQARLAAILSSDPEARELTRDLAAPCFGPVRSPGVLVDGRPMLDARGSDEALAARLAHLAVHVRDDLGDGCRAGRARAVASEERARALETRVRSRHGLGPAPDETRDAAADYASRCERP
jgi:hypothetical protein